MYNYDDTLSLLLKRTSNPKLGLSRIQALISALGKPKKIKSVQIVGTNGKGSSVAFLESILHAHGQKTLLFTSPHLCTARERFRINKEIIGEEDFVHAASRVLSIAKSHAPDASFFECITAMALYLAQEKSVDVIILEAGMGGRLDATTALKADFLGLSSVSFDHQNVLGESLKAICREKITAARPGQRVFISPQVAEVENELLAAQKDIGFELKFSKNCLLPLGLLGDFQKENAGLALALAHELGARDQKKCAQGLLEVRWPGRFEQIAQGRIILDGAHNPAGIGALNQALTKYAYDKKDKILVYGSLAGPNNHEKIRLILEHNFSHIILHSPDNIRAMSSKELADIFISFGFNKNALSTFTTWDNIIKKYYPSTSIIVCGSLYTVGAIRSLIYNINCDKLGPNY